jgi:hypothetical protein
MGMEFEEAAKDRNGRTLTYLPFLLILKGVRK